MAERKDLSELELIAQRLEQAKFPEQVFGSLEGIKNPLEQGYSTYRQLAKLTHPDLCTDPALKELAEKTFTRLHIFWKRAKSRLEEGTYGVFDPFGSGQEISITVAKKEYTVTDSFYEGVLFNFYPCTFYEGGSKQRGVFKINRDSADNDRLVKEAKVLKRLTEAERYSKFSNYFPHLVDSFRFVDLEDPTPRQANILRAASGLYCLQEVKEVYPKGIDPKDMAWIWRRLLVGLGFAHHNDMLHGALLPQNIFIHPQKHGLVITEWSNALVDARGAVNTIEPLTSESANWYPKKVLTGEDLNPGLDIYMAAKSMTYLLGEDLSDKRIRTFFNGCTLTNLSRNPQDAWALLQEFNVLIENLWGPRKFHPFTMPKRVCLNAFW